MTNSSTQGGSNDGQPAREWLRVGRAAALPPGNSVRVEIDGHSPIALFREAGGYYALDEHCLHQGGPLSEGSVQDGVVTCPWHRWRYDLRSGERADRCGSRLRVYPVDVQDGWILIGLDR